MDEIEVDDYPDCRTCGGPMYVLGELGGVAHLRCRNCGCDRAVIAFEIPEEE